MKHSLIRSLSVLLTLCLAFAAFSSAAGVLAAAVPSATIKAGPVADGKVTVAVDLTNCTGLQSFDLAVKYDNTKLTFASAAAAADLAGLGVSDADEAGDALLVSSSVSGVVHIIGYFMNGSKAATVDDKIKAASSTANTTDFSFYNITFSTTDKLVDTDDGSGAADVSVFCHNEYNDTAAEMTASDKVYANASSVITRNINKSLDWKYDPATGTLTIIGVNEIPAYSNGTAPWYRYHSYIRTVNVQCAADSNAKGITKVNAGDLYNFTALTSLTIGNSQCDIDKDALTLCPASLTIYGVKGSKAADFATTYNYKFVEHTHTRDAGKVTNAANCVNTGTVDYTCTVCGFVEKDVVLPIDPNNHTGKTDVRGYIAATCGKDGYTGDTYCSDCNTKLSDGSVIPATGDHTWGEGVVTTKATCVSTGVMTYTCSVCGQTKTEEIPIDPTAHTGETELRGAVEATCGKDGYTGDTYCKSCGNIITNGTVIPATGKHTWGKGTVTKAATCAAEGVMTYTCSVCGQTKTEAIAKNPSNHTGETVIKNAVAATCGKDGYSGDTYCKGCGVLLKTGSVVKATGNHTWGKWVFDANGVGTRTCSVCGQTETKGTVSDGPKTVTDKASGISLTYTKAAFTSAITLKVTDNGAVSPSAAESLGTKVYNDYTVSALSGSTAATPAGGSFQLSFPVPSGASSVTVYSVAADGKTTELKSTVSGSTVTVTTTGLGEFAVVNNNKQYFLRGDLDKDGSVTAADARLALRAAVKLDPSSDELALLADCDDDTAVTAADARLILRVAVNLDTFTADKQKVAITVA